MNNTKENKEMQEVFKPKREKNIELEDSFIRLKEYERAERVKNCGTLLKFKECSCGEISKLIGANFCRDRLCPMCNWRRSRLLYGQILQMLHVAAERRSMKYIFLTLTVKNCEGARLGEVLDDMFDGFHDLLKIKRIDKAVVGWIRSLEITYNKRDKTFHPHFHVLIGANERYFTQDLYITQAEWTSMWQKSMRAEYTPIVNVKKVRPKKEGHTIESAVAETSKYSVKDSDYIVPGDLALTDELISVFMNSLKGRRLVGFGKLFKKIRSELKQQDVNSDDVDLVGTTCENETCQICNSDLKETLYRWDSLLSNYRKVDKQ